MEDEKQKSIIEKYKRVQIKRKMRKEGYLNG